MYRIFFLSLISFSLFADQSFNQLKDELSADLLTIDLELSGQVSSLSEGLRQLNDFVINAGGSSDYDQGYSAGADAAASIVRTRISNCIQSLNYARSEITACQDILVGMNAPEGIDYTPYLAQITNQLNRSLFNQSTTHDKLNQIITLLGNIQSGSGSSSQVSTQLGNILSKLNWIEQYAGEVDDYLKRIYHLLYDPDSIYQVYLNLAHSRLLSPDENMLTDLNQMWYDTVQHFAVVVTSLNWEVSEQISSVADDDSIHLSNEGEIALQNLAMNERQYLCSVETLKAIRGMTNGSDVAWITNYLDKVQAPFYRLFNAYTPYALTVNPFYYQNITVITNFYTNPLYPTFSRFKVAHTNWFDRMELHLLNLSGLFDRQDVSTPETENMLDPENIERNIDYSTNALLEAVNTYANISNAFNSVVASFTDLCNAFDLSNSGDTSPITLLPSFQMGGIQIEHIDLTSTDFSFIQDGCRYVFTCIWYLVFGFLGFKYICILVYLIGRTIARSVLIISTLLSH